MPLVKVLDRKVGPVQYRARWIDKERRLCKLLVPHLGHNHDGDNTTECLPIIFVDVEFAHV